MNLPEKTTAHVVICYFFRGIIKLLVISFFSHSVLILSTITQKIHGKNKFWHVMDLSTLLFILMLCFPPVVILCNFIFNVTRFVFFLSAHHAF